jgi:pimeloyl-ACP methyl ester carboxylesterase
MLKKNSVELSSCNASYLEKPSGNATTTILMVHGNSLSKETFLQQLESGRLDQYRLIAVDLPGHGETVVNSKSDKTIFSINGMAEFIGEFAENVIDGDLVLVGHSLGGHLCVQAASEISRVRGFFLMGTPPLTTTAEPVSPFNDHPAMAFLFKDELESKELDIVVNSMHNGSDETAKVIREAFLKTDSTLRSSLGQSVISGDYKDELDELGSIGMHPALVLGGEDELINAGYVKKIAKTTGWRNKLNVIPAAGHMVQLEAPEAVNNFLAEYLSFIDSKES